MYVLYNKKEKAYVVANGLLGLSSYTNNLQNAKQFVNKAAAYGYLNSKGLKARLNYKVVAL